MLSEESEHRQTALHFSLNCETVELTNREESGGQKLGWEK
jgi:hypothetical protein